MGYYSRSEVQDLLSLIEHLAVPSNITALVSFLSSPFSGLSLGEVSLLLEEAGQEGSLADLPRKLKETYPCISRNIEHWRRIATLEGISKVFSLILEKGEVLLSFPVWKRKKAAANLRKAIDIAREYEQTLGTDMRGCAAYLRGSMGRGIAMEDASSTGEKDDVVRIMTVHASKGLEFPLLAIMGMEHTPKDRTPGTSLSPSGLLGCSISRYPEDVVPTTSDDPPSAFLSRLLDRQEQQEEWQRLFYVAATRARDALILCGTLKCKEGKEPVPPEGSWLSMIWNNHDIDIPLLQDHIEGYRESSGKGSSVPVQARSVPIPSRDGMHLSRFSATSYSLFRFCPFAWRMRHRQGRNLKWELPGGDGYGGADLGSLAHWILRKWDFREDSLDELLPSEMDLQKKAGSGIPSFLLPLWERENERTTLRKWLLQLADSSAGIELRSLLEKGILSREIPFRVKMDQGPILTGTMDLMWRDRNTVYIRDYKITAMEKAPEELYTDQLRFYGLATLNALEDRELQLDMRLIHLREGIQTGKICLPEDGLESVKKDILSAACKAAQGPFEPQTAKCGTCPFRKDCTFHIAEGGQ
jgi:ATP-dependent exoDNAse (exonuclease V) beta subunit